jgi:hypothetical protein
MIVPQYWAEARLQGLKSNHQVTVRRFGWSDSSQSDAQAMADARAQESLRRLLLGEQLPRREPKVPYNGSQGVPIREEIISRHGETVVTRNSYGAHCLNTPNVLFVDIDLVPPPKISLPEVAIGLLALLLVLLSLLRHSIALLVVLGALVLFTAWYLVPLVRRWRQTKLGGPEGIARARIGAFVKSHPDWHLRLYLTPAGLRVLAMHRPFDPTEKAVTECFQQLGADPIYVRMCLNQHCFRARVSPKPWRIGIEQHIRPQPGVWPVAPERLPLRSKWVDRYEALASEFASCRFIEAVGSSTTHPTTLAVQQLHDDLCQAQTELPIA